jgi:hypothetical protein
MRRHRQLRGSAPVTRRSCQTDATRIIESSRLGRHITQFLRYTVMCGRSSLRALTFVEPYNVNRGLFLLLLLLSAACATTKSDRDCSIGGCQWGEIRDGKFSFPPRLVDAQAALVLSPFADGKFWLVRENFTWPSSRFGFETVKAGFVTDFASIPRPLWILLPKWDGYGSPAIVHDYLYSTCHLTRKNADLWLLIAMDDMRVGTLKRYTIYAAVRLFGGFAWRSNERRAALRQYNCIDPVTMGAPLAVSTWDNWQDFSIPCTPLSEPNRTFQIKSAPENVIPRPPA